MLPFWKYDEAEAGVYQRVHRHSPGMISIAYKPPSAEILELAGRFETFGRSGAGAGRPKACARPGSTVPGKAERAR